MSQYREQWRVTVGESQDRTGLQRDKKRKKEKEKEKKTMKKKEKEKKEKKKTTTKTKKKEKKGRRGTLIYKNFRFEFWALQHS
jgi:hypothetical protein